MESMRAVRWKVYRAKEHYDQLLEVLRIFYERGPSEIGQIREESPTSAIFEAKEDIPGRIPLIFGDAIQNLRSALDYLIWELVLANNETPGQQNAFPICTTKATYDNEVDKRQRLKGASEVAEKLVRSFQPFHAKEPSNHPLAILTP